MAAIRTSLFLFVVLVNLQHVVLKPFLEPLICDFFCTDNDNTTTTISSNQQDMFDQLCEDCTPRPRRTSTQLPINLMIPPMNGMNLTMVSQGGNWLFNMIPWSNGVPNFVPNGVPNAVPNIVPTAFPQGFVTMPTLVPSSSS